MALDPPAVPTKGVEPVERAAGVDFRWLCGPGATIRLNLDRPERLRLVLALSNPLEGQTVTVLVDGLPVAAFENLPGDQRLTGFKPREVLFDLQPGTHAVGLAFSRYNRRSTEDTFAPEDKRGLAAMASVLTVSPAR